MIVEIPYRTIHLSINTDALCDKVILNVSTAPINFDCRSFITDTNYCCFKVFGDRVYIPTDSIGLLGEVDCKGCHHIIV